MSDTGTLDRRRIQQALWDEPSRDSRLAVALGLIAVLIGFGAAAAGTWIAYGQTGLLIPLPGGLPSAEAQTVSIYLVACGVLTMILGAFSIRKSRDM